ncbi:hypothetical protein G9A89_002212 [Geosiphon pyriformis]|nr:hypothetical protein G9A89_002212 [Geosiphon pyriformis]
MDYFPRQQQHETSYFAAEYHQTSAYSEEDWFPFVEFQISESLVTSSLFTTSKEHFANLGRTNFPINTPVKTTTTAVFNDTIDKSNQNENNSTSLHITAQPSKIISSLVEFIASEFNEHAIQQIDSELDHSNDAYSNDTPGFSSSSSVFSSGPQTPVDRNPNSNNNTISMKRDRLNSRKSLRKMNTSSTEKSYFDGWDGTFVEESIDSIIYDEKFENAITLGATKEKSNSYPFMDYESPTEPLLSDEDHNSSFPSIFTTSPIDAQKGFFKTLFNGKSTSREQTPKSTNNSNNNSDKKRRSKSPTNRGIMSPQEQYKLNLHQHYQNVITMARKQNVSASFRREAWAMNC